MKLAKSYFKIFLNTNMWRRDGVVVSASDFRSNGRQSRTQRPQALWPAIGRQETNHWPKSLRTLGERLDGRVIGGSVVRG